MKLEAISNSVSNLDQKTLLEEVKRHRSSALIDGICMGIGFVFIVLGIMIPIILSDQIINGLLAIIGGMLVTVIGGMMEVYHWAKLR
jgi:hypothetical protein